MSIIQKILKLAGKSPRLKSAYHNSSFLQNLMVSIQQKHYRNMDPADYPAELKRWFFQKTGMILNLDDPQTFNEKIQWMKLYDSTPLKTRLADKYLVREWVAEKIGEEYLIPLLGVWDTFDEIDFDTLPNQFVLKANHGCGWNVIVRDKAAFDKKDAKKKFDRWMKTNFAYKAGLELHYRDIVPKIIAEKYIESPCGDLYDYKFLCFSGRVKYIWVDSGRYVDHRRDFYNINWEHQPFINVYPNSQINHKKPDNLDKMIELANILSSGFSHVRVDFYDVNDKIYFGEMTFTSANGAKAFTPEEYDRILGELIILNIKN